jgi:hypothetical protein
MHNDALIHRKLSKSPLGGGMVQFTKVFLYSNICLPWFYPDISKYLPSYSSNSIYLETLSCQNTLTIYCTTLTRTISICLHIIHALFPAQSRIFSQDTSSLRYADTSRAVPRQAAAYHRLRCFATAWFTHPQGKGHP